MNLLEVLKLDDDQRYWWLCKNETLKKLCPELMDAYEIGNASQADIAFIVRDLAVKKARRHYLSSLQSIYATYHIDTKTADYENWQVWIDFYPTPFEIIIASLRVLVEGERK